MFRHKREPMKFSRQPTYPWRVQASEKCMLLRWIDMKRIFIRNGGCLFLSAVVLATFFFSAASEQDRTLTRLPAPVGAAGSSTELYTGSLAASDWRQSL